LLLFIITCIAIFFSSQQQIENSYRFYIKFVKLREFYEIFEIRQNSLKFMVLE